MKKILLYSGGMDSWLINQLWKPDKCIYIDMSSQYSDNELVKIQICEDVKIDIVQMPLGKFERSNSIIPLRNLYLIMLACNISEDEDVEICLGTTEGDSYRTIDHSEKFLNDTEQLLNYLYQPQSWLPKGKHIKIMQDYSNLTKAELLRKYIADGGNIKKAYNNSLSCYHPNGLSECWSCNACFRKYIAFKINGYIFDEVVDMKCKEHYERVVKHQMQNGVFAGPKEDAEIIKIMEV